MPTPKDLCSCGQMKRRPSEMCRECRRLHPYERTEDIRGRMSAAQAGRPRKTGWKHSPETRAKIASAWTPEKREAARERGLAFADDPTWRSRVGTPGPANANYQGKGQEQYGPGFSRGMKKRLIAKRGSLCERCGSAKKLVVHHRDFAATDHSEANLAVLCYSCHGLVHAAHRSG